MNIFASDKSPILSAKALDNIRLNKMVLESAQLLSTRLSLPDVFQYEDKLTNVSGILQKVYKPTHQNHPCSLWVAESSFNYKWLLEHFVALCEEFQLRSGKIHETSKLIDPLTEGFRFISTTKSFSEHVNCCSSDRTGSFSHIGSVYVAYRMYLAAKWKTDTIKVSWEPVSPPSWLTPEFTEYAIGQARKEQNVAS